MNFSISSRLIPKYFLIIKRDWGSRFDICFNALQLIILAIRSSSLFRKQNRTFTAASDKLCITFHVMTKIIIRLIDVLLNTDKLLLCVVLLLSVVISSSSDDDSRFLNCNSASSSVSPYKEKRVNV